MVENKVSIIIPTYNSEDFIDDTLLSLNNQTYKDIEVIIVDDCSNDRTYDHLLELKGKENYFFSMIIDKLPSNSGQGNARNKGLDLATGQYIMFLDSDDKLESVAVERMVSNIYDTDICICSFYRQRGDNIQKNMFSRKEGIYSVSDFLSNLLIEWPINWLSCIGNKIYKREIILSNTIRFNDTEYRYNEDLAFAVDYIRACNRVRVINDELYSYTYTIGSVQHKNTYIENSIITIRNARLNLYKLISEYSLQNEVLELLTHSMVDLYFVKLITKWGSYTRFQTVFYQVCDFPEIQEIKIQGYSVLKKIFLKLAFLRRAKLAYVFFNFLNFGKLIYSGTKNTLFKVG